MAQGGGRGYGEKWVDLRYAVAMELKELTEEFNMRSNLTGLANLLPIHYTFIQFLLKSLKLKMSNYYQLYLNKMRGAGELQAKFRKWKR